MLLLKEKRKERRLTQQELAELSGVTQQTISQIECDPSSNPGIKTVVALALAMGMTVIDLYQPDEAPKQQPENVAV